MKKAKQHFFNIGFLLKESVLCLFLFLFTNCGLDDFYILEAAYTDGHMVYYDTAASNDRYFSFITSETGANSDYLAVASSFKFQGTEVYYKIYNNYSTLSSVASSISSLNTVSNYSAAAEKLIDTYGYKTLKFSSGSFTPLVKADGTNKYVYIKLTTVDKDTPPCICVGNEKMSVYDASKALKYNGQNVLPRRNITSSSQAPQGYSFDFKINNDEENRTPLETDEDVSYSSSSTEDGTWYVDMYAISQGYDTTYTMTYSLVYYMGVCAIVEGSTNN